MRFLSVRAGVASELPGPPERIADDEFLWCDCTYDEARAWVGTVESLTGVTAVEEHLLDAENRQHPSYFDSTDDYEMIVFRGVVLGSLPADETEPLRVRTRPTVCFLFPRCLVTVRAADSRGVQELRAKLLAPTGSAQRVPRSPEGLAMRLLYLMIDRYLALRQPLTELLERWQRMLLDPRRPFRDWLALLEARAELRKLEQLCEEQLDALQAWRDTRVERAERDDRDDGPADNGRPRIGPLTETQLVRLRDLTEHVHRVLSHAQRLQESVETAVDLHFSATAHRTNETMRTLTTITAIFLPLTLITGVFGMNFEFIPGMHSRNGFWIAIAAMGAIAALLLAFVRARRLLDTPVARRRRRAKRHGEPPPGRD